MLNFETETLTRDKDEAQTAAERLEDFLNSIELEIIPALKICKEKASELDNGEIVIFFLKAIQDQMQKQCADVQEFLNNN